MKASVYKSTGSWYSVRDEHGEMRNARIKGKLKIGGLTSTNPVAVGDVVNIEIEREDSSDALIVDVEDRRNHITRTSPHNRFQQHIVAANLDQSLLFATLRDPKTSLGFIDRFLITAEAYQVPAIIVFNKTDLLKTKDLTRLDEVQMMYETAGYKVMRTSITENIGLAEVANVLHNKTTLLTGHSGVGKSTFINHLFPGLSLRTKDVSDWSGKGMHTTTFAEMFDLPTGGRIIDTPGIRELGLFDITRQELSHYYPEMRALINDCQFNNCMHINEPGCAVKNAVQNGALHSDRFVSYLSILETIVEHKY
ncbi:MAG: hypothetical protein RLY16_2317 [Bacteroidota bacterium]|jgi:ribosome biogenesis GTPase